MVTVFRFGSATTSIVSRLKSNTPLSLVHEQVLPEGSDPGDGSKLLYDRIGHLPERLSRTRRNPFADPVREIGVRIATGKTLRIVSNDLDAPAAEIAALYKRRWAIELFFRWVKQTLRIRHFLGRTENAVRIQIAVALIAYLLLRLANAAHTVTESPLAFTRLIRANLMHKRSIDSLLKPKQQPRPLSPQLKWEF